MFVGELQQRHAEAQRHSKLANQLGFLVQTQVPGLDQLDVVVSETQSTQAHGEPQHQQPRGGEPTGTTNHRVEVGDHIGEHNARQNRDATHGGGAALAQVRLGALLADLLPQAFRAESTDQHRSKEDRHQEAQCPTDNYLSHY